MWPWRGEFKFSFWALFMHAELDGKRTKTGPMCCLAQKMAHGDGGTSDLAPYCGGTTGFTGPYPGSNLYNNRIMNCFRHKPESRDGAPHIPLGRAP